MERETADEMQIYTKLLWPVASEERDTTTISNPSGDNIWSDMKSSEIRQARKMRIRGKVLDMLRFFM